MNVTHYISELLYRHECVVVPGFGAFVTTYASAKVHPAQHTFTPPSKQIVFNKHLQQNDGLLAQTIVDESGCTFDEAMKGIRVFVEDVMKKLKQKEKAVLHNIGVLSLDPEGNFVFEADADVNYLIGSFGLSSFQSMPILRETVLEKRKPVERVDRVVPEEKVQITEKAIAERPRRGRVALVTTAVALPLIIAGLWFTSVNTNALAGFGIFGKRTVSMYKPGKFQADLSGINSPDLIPDQNGIARINLADNAPDIIVNIHKVVPDSTMVAKALTFNSHPKSNWQGNKFYVIAGAFAVPENVEKFRHALEGKGYSTEIVERMSSKLTHIGVGAFASKEEAEKFISTISGDVPGAWILKK